MELEIDIQLRNGVCIDASSLPDIHADGAQPDKGINILSHAHGDHLFEDGDELENIICSRLTSELAAARLGLELEDITIVDHEDIELLPSGHIAGSRAALIESAEGDILYTGDVATRDRYYLNGFEPVSADILIIESTYGKPEYEFPPLEVVERKVLDWLETNLDRPVVLFGYALGKAQKLQKLVQASDRDRVFTTEAVLEMNEIISRFKEVEFSAEEFDSESDMNPGDVLILPSGLGQFEWVENIVEQYNALTAGFSGWAHDESFIYRRNLDEGFIVSDHCDFLELISIVEAVDPEIVYTQHGFSNELSRELTKRGYTAQALHENQTSLGEFK